jgi:hypothetical protein
MVAVTAGTERAVALLVSTVMAVRDRPGIVD